MNVAADAGKRSAANDYDFTTKLLYTLCRTGANVPIMDYGLNVAVDLMSFAAEITSVALGENKDEIQTVKVSTMESLRAEAQRKLGR